MKRISLTCLAILAASLSRPLLGQGTAFTYQGLLGDSGAAAAGSYDLTFALFSADTGANQLGGILTNLDITVDNGRFTVLLDFGPGMLTGPDRWLEIGVRTNGGNAFTTLAPRQKLTPSPYTITAANLSGILGAASLVGTYSSPINLDNVGNSFSGNGSQLTGLNAANLTTGVVAIAQGGTAATNGAAARANLGAAAFGANADITSLSGLTTPLPVTEGGTGAGTAAGALANLGGVSLTATNIFTGVNIMSHPDNAFGGSFAGDGSALTSLDAANVSTGLLPLARGGTGAGSAAGARASLGAAASGANADITALSGLNSPLSISQGGTGGTTASNGLANLGGVALAGTNNFTGVNVLIHPANLFGGSFSGDGSALTGLNAANLSSGLVPISRGGTGAGTALAARVGLGAAASGANSDISSLAGLSTPLSLVQGGTGANTPANALSNLAGASLAGNNAFAGVNLLTNPANAFIGSFAGQGSGLTNLNAANLTSGILPNAQLAGTYSSPVNFTNPGDLFAGSFNGDGSALTALNAANISAGLLTVARGGTGAGTSAAARANLAAASSGANSDITSLSGLIVPLSISQGGTGAGTASNAVLNLGAASLSGSNIFAGVNTLTNAANSFAGTFGGIGLGLSNLNAASFSTGILPSAQLAGTYSSPLTLNSALNSFVGGFTGNGSALSNVNALSLSGLPASSFWQLGGNAGTTPGANYLGTSDGQPLTLQTTGGVGINTNNPAGKTLAINGSAAISSNNALEFGYDAPGKQQNAGKIGYETFTPGALDIVGAGTNSTSRRVKIWAEAGTMLNGAGTNTVLTLNNTVDEQTSLAFTAPFSTWHVGQNKPADAPSAFDSFFIYQDSAATTRLLITSDGRIGLNTNNPVFPLSLGNGAYCTAGGQWTSVSDRNAKEGFTAIDPKQILAKVAMLPITQWKYKAETNGVRHLGPMAQDFKAAFGLGDNDKAIGSVDADGVALAAIQGLNQLIRDKDAEIKALKAKSADLEARLNALETANPRATILNTPNRP
jgi:endosialidase-like protein